MNDLVGLINLASKNKVLSIIDGLSDSDLHSFLNKNMSDVICSVFNAANQALASRMLKVLSADSFRKALRISDASSLKNILNEVQASQLSKVLAGANEELISRIIDSAPSHKHRIGIAKALPVDRRSQWVALVRSMESEIGQTHSLAIDASTSLYEERKRALEGMDEAIRTKETMIQEMDRDLKSREERLFSLEAENRIRLSSLQEEINHKQEELIERERSLLLKVAEFEEANRKQVQQRIELKVPEYVAAAVSVLHEREVLYRKKSSRWSWQGVVVLFLAIVSVVAISLYGTGFGVSLDKMGWQILLFVSFKGLVVLGVLGLWAKHAFTISNAYMHESIKRSDRAHAINFGKLYLEIYGNSVDRKELISIFENWNIASESAFSNANPVGFEPEILSKVESIFSIVSREKKD